MKPFVLASVAAPLALCAGAALADGTPPAGAAAPPTYTMPTHTIVLRTNKPMVLIDIRRPTAAAEAGAAHESLRASLLQQAVPATLKAP